MINIGELFKKIQNRHSKELFLRSTIQESIKKHTNIDLKVADISVKSGVVSLKNISQTAKSQVFIRKQAVMNEVNALQQIQKITEIR